MCPLVTIITVCFNSAGTLEKTIKSICEQTYSNIEYIIIDGGSTDGTLDIIKKYQHRIAFWVSEKDEGISDAWNKGLDRATGDIIGIINSDDWYEENAVERAVESLISNKQFDFVFGDLLYYNKKNELVNLQKGKPNYHNTLRYSMPSISHPTVFMRKQVYDRCGNFNERFKIAMDFEFLLRISSFGYKGLYIDSHLANMTLGGISDRDNFKGYKEELQISLMYNGGILSYIYYYKKFIKAYIRLALDFIGILSVMRKLRIKRHLHFFSN